MTLIYCNRNEVWRYQNWPGTGKSARIMFFRGFKYAAALMALTIAVDTVTEFFRIFSIFFVFELILMKIEFSWLILNPCNSFCCCFKRVFIYNIYTMVKLYIYTYVTMCLKAFPFYVMFLSLSFFIEGNWLFQEEGCRCTSICSRSSVNCGKLHRLFIIDCFMDVMYKEMHLFT